MPKKTDPAHIQKQLELMDHDYNREQNYQQKKNKQIKKAQARGRHTQGANNPQLFEENQGSYEQVAGDLLRSAEDWEYNKKKEDSEYSGADDADAKGKEIQVAPPSIPQSPYLVFHYEKLQEYQLKLQIQNHKRKHNADTNTKYQKNKNKNLLKLLPKLQFYSQWQSLTPQQKSPYYHSYQQRSLKFNKLKQQYQILISNGRSMAKSPNQSRIATPYSRYYQEMYEFLEAKSKQKYDLNEIRAIIKNTWDNLDREDKIPYEIEYETERMEQEEKERQGMKELRDNCEMLFQAERDKRFKEYKEKLVLYAKQEDLLSIQLKEKYDLRKEIMEQASQLVNSQKLLRKHQMKIKKQQASKQNNKQMQNIVENNLSMLIKLKLHEIRVMKSKRKDKPTIPYDAGRFMTPAKLRKRRAELCTTGRPMEDSSQLEDQIGSGIDQQESYSLEIYQQEVEGKKQELGKKQTLGVMEQE